MDRYVEGNKGGEAERWKKVQTQRKAKRNTGISKQKERTSERDRGKKVKDACRATRRRKERDGLV